ncbi:MAG TPA: oligosaccharide flippase family protein [Candidatus Dormibacteraeota bacterium]
MTTTEAAAGAARAEAAATFSLRRFVQAAGVLSITSVAAFVRAVITAKLFAITLGPSAVGVISQLLNFSAFVFTILPLGLTTGVTKMVAESVDERRRTDAVVGSSAAISLISGVAALVLLAPLSGQISNLLTGSPRYGLLVLLILLSFPLNNLGQVMAYVVQGFADIRGLTIANVVTSAISVVAVLAGTLQYGLTGAIASVFGTSIVQAAVFTIAVLASYRARRWKPALSWSGAAARELIGYGWIMILAGMAIWGSVLATRTIAVRALGEYQNGIYQVGFGLSLQYMTVFMTWMAAYVFPRLTGQRSDQEIGGLLNSALRANVFIMVPALALAIALRDPLIRVFYSSAFLAASPLVVIQALGDYARVIGWSFGVVLFAQGHTRAYLVAILAQALSWVAITVATIHPLGVMALALGYSLSYIAWPVLMYPMARHWFGVRISGEGASLALIGIAVLAAAALIPAPLGAPLALVIPAVIVWRRRRLRLA